MGFDISGLDPKTEAGYNFRCNIWSWGAILAQVKASCSDLVPEDILEQMQNNEGSGISDGEICFQMAQRLQSTLDETPVMEEIYGETLPIAELLATELLEGSDKEQVQNQSVASRQQLEEFIFFLQNCGGFEVR